MSMVIFEMPAVLPAPFSTVYRYTNMSSGPISTEAWRRAADNG